MDSCDETTLTNPSQKGKSKKESIDFWFKKPTYTPQKRIPECFIIPPYFLINGNSIKLTKDRITITEC